MPLAIGRGLSWLPRIEPATAGLESTITDTTPLKTRAGAVIRQRLIRPGRPQLHPHTAGHRSDPRRRIQIYGTGMITGIAWLSRASRGMEEG